MQTILIVEDNEEIQSLLREILEEKYEVLSAFSGTEALLIFHQKQVDLFLLDIMLPGKTGDDVLRSIREQDRKVPIIMISARSEKKKISQLLLNGADDYITKPFDLEEVCARISVQLRSKDNTSKVRQMITFKNLQVDTSTYTIIGLSENIQLRKYEFQILQLLLSNPRQIFTKEQIFEHVWKEPYFHGENTLNMHLSNLRKKIAIVDAENEYIETIYGIGIRMKGKK